MRGFVGLVGDGEISRKWTKLGASLEFDSLIIQINLRCDAVLAFLLAD